MAWSNMAHFHRILLTFAPAIGTGIISGVLEQLQQHFFVSLDHNSTVNNQTPTRLALFKRTSYLTGVVVPSIFTVVLTYLTVASVTPALT
jgi:hypothetical protein